MEKKIGRVKKIIREEHSNEIKELIITSPFRKKIFINPSHIKRLGESIILKQPYRVKKKYFWQKS